MRGKRTAENLGKKMESQNPSPAISGPQESPYGESQETARRKTGRRRGVARRPYQDKLLNMAEARREIVTALKLHRASMKQGRGENPTGPETELLGPVKESPGLKSRRSPRIYASNYYVGNITNAYPGLYYSRPVCPFAPPPFYHAPENHLNLVLPSQTLGLNLDLQGFNNLDTSFLCSSANNNSYSSSQSASCSPPLSGGAAAEEISYMAGDPASVGDDEQQQKIGWGDDLDIGVSDGRAEFLGPEQDLGTEDFGVSLEFPAWVNIGDESCVTHHLCSGAAYFQDPALPCMDIEEIEGMDDWLA